MKQRANPFDYKIDYEDGERMKLPYSERLDIKYLARVFDNKSECYKLFWLEAIINKVVKGNDNITYDELINEMVSSAWYMVSEYHLNLGPADTLESLVHRVFKLSDGALKTSDTKENIIAFLIGSQDTEVKKMKRTLTRNVPYRLQAPFMERVKGKEWDVSEKKLADKINQEERLMYYFTAIAGMMSSISIQKEWCDYISANQEIIKGWIEYNKIMYLQRRNPSVPGIANKLYPEQERDLEKVKKYWKTIIKIKPVVEIYGGNKITDNDIISIDHFIPWSYVAHDELWNLTPTTRSINSTKSNCLPKWDTYFAALCDVEYNSYEMVWQYDDVRCAFEKCLDNNVNSEDVKQRLYRSNLEKTEFCHSLKEIMLPVYQAAGKIGFRDWEL